jgi:hypothetical protein
MKYYKYAMEEMEKNILYRQKERLIKERDQYNEQRKDDAMLKRIKSTENPKRKYVSTKRTKKKLSERSSVGFIGTKDRDNDFDKYEEMAKRIASAMRRRVAKGLPAIKGSEYAFLGYWKVEHSKIKGTKYSPSYRKFDTPLWTSSSGDGAINQAISSVVSLWFDSFMAETVSSSYKGKTLLDSLLRVHSRYKDIQGVGNQFFDLADRYVQMINIIRGTEEKKRTSKQSRLLDKLLLEENKKKLHDMGLKLTVDYNDELKFIQIIASKKVTAELERALRNQRNRAAKRLKPGTWSNMKKRKG